MRDLRDIPSLRSGERQALLHALFSDREPPDDPQLRARLSEVADAYAVGPALRSAWARQMPDDDIAETAAGDVAGHMLLLADLHTALAALQCHGIRSIVLKGGALIAAGIVPIGARHTHDVDLWIDPAQWIVAERVLNDAGFGIDPEFERTGVDGRARSDLRWADLHSGVPRLGPLGTPCDLHRTVPGLNPKRWRFDAVWERGQSVDVQGAEARIPSLADLLVALCDHVVVRHPLDPRLFLRHLCDLAALQRMRPLEALLAESRCSPSERLAVEASVRLLRAAETADPRFVATLGTVLLAPPPRVARLADLAAHWSESAAALGYDAVHRPSVLARRFFPDPAWMAEHYGVAPGDRMQLARGYARRLASLPLRPLLKERR